MDARRPAKATAQTRGHTPPRGRRGIVDDGILPLQHFVDSGGPDGVAIAVEADPKGALYPAVYVRRDNRMTETLLASDPVLDFETAEHRSVLTAALDGMFD